LIGGLSRVSRYMTVAVVYDPDSRIFIIGAFNEYGGPGLPKREREREAQPMRCRKIAR
jgi:hypothetical protein